MMYSPDIPAAGERADDATRARLGSYYSSADSEESTKCVASTTLFVLVLVAFVLVLLLMNPQM